MFDCSINASVSASFCTWYLVCNGLDVGLAVSRSLLRLPLSST